MHKPPFFKVIVSLVTAVTLFVQTVPGLTLIGEKTSNEKLSGSIVNSFAVTSTPTQSPTVSEPQNSLLVSAPDGGVTHDPSIPLQSAIPTASSDKTEDNSSDNISTANPNTTQLLEKETSLLGETALASPVVNFSQLLKNVKVEYGSSSQNVQQIPSTLDKDSSLWITYLLKDIGLEDLTRLSIDPYSVDVPTYLKTSMDTLGSYEVNAPDVGRVATLSFENGGITFTFDITNLNNHQAEFPIVDLSFSFGANLDMNQVGGRQAIHLQVEQDMVQLVNVQNNIPKDAEIIEKKGVYNTATGAVDWTVTLGSEIARFVLNDPVDPTNPDAGALEFTPYIFEDELGNDQYYLPDSFAIDGNQPTPTLGLSYDEANHRLSCTLVDGLANGATLTYSTLPEKSLLYTYDEETGQYTIKTPNKTGLPVQNKAQLKKQISAPSISEKSATSNFEVKEWIKKTGLETDFQNRTITWQLILNTNGCDFDEITVFDKLPMGLSYAGTDNLQVTAADGSLVSIEKNSVFTGQGNVGQNTEEQKLVVLKNPNPTVYTITYKTSFPESILGTGTTNYDNKAWLSYLWKVGPGDTLVPVGSPSINGNHKVNSCYITKTGTYDAKTHRITWKLEVNRNRNEITNLVVEDWIDYNSKLALEEDKQILLPDTMQLVKVNGITPPMSVSMDTLVDPSNPQKQFSLTFTGLNPTDSVLVEYQTEAIDPSFYANNASEVFYNQTTVRDDLSTTPLQTVNASPRFESKMMEKSATGYQYDTHYLGWEVQVNKNELIYLPNAMFIDVLPPHLQLDETSLRLDGTTVLGNDPVAGGGNYYSLNTETDGSKTLKVYLQDGLDTTTTPGSSIPYVNDKHAVRYNTKLDVNATPGFSFVSDNDKNYTADNTVQLESDLFKPVEARAEKKILNQSFEKTSKLQRSELTVQYTIAINQAMANLGEGPFVLEDTLPQGVLLDVDSVQLWPAKVSRDGKLQKDGNTPKSDTKIEVEGNIMHFDLNLTTETERNRAWLVTYSVDIVDGSGTYNLANHASMGLTNSGLGSSDELRFNISAAEAGAANNTRRDLQVTRQDENTKTPLPGAVFELYNTYPGTTSRYLMATATTDQNGILTFKGLKIGKEYWVKEVTTPLGYPLAPEQSIVIQRGTEGSLQEIVFESEITTTPSPTPEPSATPTVAPTATPTIVPTIAPTATPTIIPTIAPTATPTVTPSATPTIAPTFVPTSSPTTVPSSEPSSTPPADDTTESNSPQTSDKQDFGSTWNLLFLSGGLLCVLLVTHFIRRKRNISSTSKTK